MVFILMFTAEWLDNNLSMNQFAVFVISLTQI